MSDYSILKDPINPMAFPMEVYRALTEKKEKTPEKEDLNNNNSDLVKVAPDEYRRVKKGTNMADIKKTMDKAAEKGRGGDSLVGHLTPGDVIIPKELHTPEMIEALQKHLTSNGTTLERFTAGHDENSINPETGQPEFGWLKKLAKLWVPFRDTLETAAVIGGDYYLPGSSSLTSKLASKGSQEQLNSTIGKISQIGASAAGAGVGSSVTGIPASSGYTGVADSLGELVGDPTLGTDIGTSIGNFGRSIGNSTGLSDLFGGSSAGAGSSSDVAGDFGGFSGAGSGGGSLAAPSSSSFNFDTSYLDSFGSDFTTPVSSNVGSGTFGTPGFSSNLSSPVANSISNSGVGAGGSSNTLQSFLDHPGVGAAWDMIKANPNVALNAAGMGVNAALSNRSMSGEGALKSAANSLGAQGAELQKYLESGTLPPGLQQGINQASEAAKAQIRSKYASMGMSGSSAEQQELAAVDQRAQAQGAQYAMQLLTTGINETGMASKLYDAMLGHAIEGDKELGSAISNFASSFAGSGQGGGTTINIGAHG